MVEWKYTLFSAHSCPSRLVNLSPRYGSVIELIQARLELANRFSPVYISPMCSLYSQTRNVEAIRRLFRISDNRASRLDPQPAIFPGWTAPVIRKAEDGERELLRCRGVSCSYSRARLPAGSPTWGSSPAC
jgi:hypothetical protein